MNISEKEIIAVLADALCKDPEEISLHDRLQEDLGADSLDAVEVVMEIEEKFKIEISDSQAESIKTVNDLINEVTAAKAA